MEYKLIPNEFEKFYCAISDKHYAVGMFECYLEDLTRENKKVPECVYAYNVVGYLHTPDDPREIEFHEVKLVKTDPFKLGGFIVSMCSITLLILLGLLISIDILDNFIFTNIEEILETATSPQLIFFAAKCENYIEYIDGILTIVSFVLIGIIVLIKALGIKKQNKKV